LEGIGRLLHRNRVAKLRRSEEAGQDLSLVNDAARGEPSCYVINDEWFLAGDKPIPPLVWETVAEPGMVVVAPNVDYKPERLPGRESALRKVGL